MRKLSLRNIGNIFVQDQYVVDGEAGFKPQMV